MNKKYLQTTLLLAAISCGTMLQAAVPMKGKLDHLYTIKITAVNGKQVPLSGSMMQWPQNAPVGFYDFHAANIYTPYEGKITASEVMLNVTASGSQTPIKVELLDDDNTKDVSLTGSGTYIMLYSNGGNGSFISTR